MFHYGKLDINNAIIEVVQSDTRIEDADHVFLSTESDFLGTSYIGQVWDRPFVKPLSVTRRQAKQQLLIDGLLSQVQPTIDGVLDATERTMLQIFWDDSQEFEREHTSLIQLATSLGLTSTQLDLMFVNAAKL